MHDVDLERESIYFVKDLHTFVAGSEPETVTDFTQCTYNVAMKK